MQHSRENQLAPRQNIHRFSPSRSGGTADATRDGTNAAASSGRTEVKLETGFTTRHGRELGPRESRTSFVASAAGTVAIARDGRSRAFQAVDRNAVKSQLRIAFNHEPRSE
jgi:hypothetical protein